LVFYKRSDYATNLVPFSELCFTEESIGAFFSTGLTGFGSEFAGGWVLTGVSLRSSFDQLVNEE
jgi:hypothetical protein